MEKIFNFSQTDPLFVEVAKYVVETGKAQASALQHCSVSGISSTRE